MQNVTIYEENQLLSILIQLLNSLTLDLSPFMVIRPGTNFRRIILIAKRDAHVTCWPRDRSICAKTG